jgi:hypothetical protein
MSRGLGAFQWRVLEALETYRRLGSALAWEWNRGSRYALANYASESSIHSYERGRYVPLWILRRDLNCTRADLSRALKALERRELAYGIDGELEVREGHYRNRKFACISDEGQAALKRQQVNCDDVGT